MTEMRLWFLFVRVLLFLRLGARCWSGIASSFSRREWVALLYSCSSFPCPRVGIYRYRQVGEGVVHCLAGGQGQKEDITPTRNSGLLVSFVYIFWIVRYLYHYRVRFR
ncbi:hypothetical protein B0T14DRAFT_213175 [Immersiella caudata]|uniref:Secreted protein n=1 Tax=Immersiella caudata TaxID=314043 RepID=A0AA39WQL6_9PEZI|nr:hypothetical protein B0T14DRAFT_213175 [Immersiella caudata]